MNTMLKTATTSTILAVDIGEYKSVGCVHEGRSRRARYENKNRLLRAAERTI
jgi:hypothetical protein